MPRVARQGGHRRGLGRCDCGGCSSLRRHRRGRRLGIVRACRQQDVGSHAHPRQRPPSHPQSAELGPEQVLSARLTVLSVAALPRLYARYWSPPCALGGRRALERPPLTLAWSRREAQLSWSLLGAGARRATTVHRTAGVPEQARAPATFVQSDRFAGTSYRAANWTHVGQTQGAANSRSYPRARVARLPPPTCAVNPHPNQYERPFSICEPTLEPIASSPPCCSSNCNNSGIAVSSSTCS